jgi:hypothetical protein
MQINNGRPSWTQNKHFKEQVYIYRFRGMQAMRIVEKAKKLLVVSDAIVFREIQVKF